MPTRRIPDTNIDISLAGLGCNNFGVLLGRYPSYAVIGAALDAGVRFFDTAGVYGDGASESYLGRALEQRRRHVVLGTKFGFDPEQRGGLASAAAIGAALDASLRRLRTDYIDLYQLHQPDPVTPMAETLGALTDLIRAGKIRAIGCCNMTAAQLAEAQRVSAAGGYARLVTVQVEWNLLSRGIERELLPLARHLGVAVIAHSPLAGGLLTGKYGAGAPPAKTRMADRPDALAPWMTPAHRARLARWQALAASAGQPLLRYALGWLARRPEVCSIIAGATRGAQVEANTRAILSATAQPVAGAVARPVR